MKDDILDIFNTPPNGETYPMGHDVSIEIPLIPNGFIGLVDVDAARSQLMLLDERLAKCRVQLREWSNLAKLRAERVAMYLAAICTLQPDEPEDAA